MSTFVMVLRIFTCSISHFGIKFNTLCLVIYSIFVTLGALLEDVHRIEDYSINVLPKVLEGAWHYLKHHGYVRDVKFSMQIIFSVSIGILLVLNKFFSKEIPAPYKSQINFVFGREDVEDTR